jgi:hypothetical protein
MEAPQSTTPCHTLTTHHTAPSPPHKALMNHTLGVPVALTALLVTLKSWFRGLK